MGICIEKVCKSQSLIQQNKIRDGIGAEIIFTTIEVMWIISFFKPQVVITKIKQEHLFQQM